ncbi:MAG: OmpH family outer membrane protein [Candidatus Tectimicrobiota bacterium]
MKRLGRTEVRRWFLVAVTLACATLLLAGPGAAEPVKIGYIDIDKIINESVPGQQAIQKLREDFERRAAELKKMEEELKKLRQELDTKGSVMSMERRRQLEEEYRGDRRDLKRAIRDNNEEFNIKRKQVLVDFLPKILTTVKAIGNEKGYTLILRKEPNILLYSADQVDLTNEVIARLNAEGSGQ